MAGLSNKDSSFFEVVSPDRQVGTQVLTQDLQQLTITEEINKITQGSISLLDPNGLYNTVLPLGTRLGIAWGYRNFDEAPRSVLTNIANPDLFTDSVERRGLEVLVMSPSGAGGADGSQTFSCNFQANTWRGADGIYTYSTGTYADVVREVLTRIGVPIQNQVVRFQLGNTQVSEDNPVLQQTSDFAFLSDKAAFEWRAIFNMAYDQKGNLHAMFIDPPLVRQAEMNQRVLGVFGRSNLFSYKGRQSNVIQYNWKNKQGESGVGDAVQVRYVNGQPTFFRYVAEEQKFFTYKLNTDAVAAERERVGAENGLAGETQWLLDYATAESFEEVKHFFDEVESGTAPQGYGYELNLRIFGNPMIMAGNVAEFEGAFPEVFRNTTDVTFYVNKVTHSISRQGYFQDIHIVDNFAFSPTGAFFGSNV
jgi:hypothetical protein